MLDLVELAADDPKPVGAYSKGMRQRVKLAAALVNDPDLLILDEPLTGLDPVQRNRMIRLFHDLGDDGKCLLVSSHVLDEVARLGSRVLVIAQGRLAATGDYRELCAPDGRSPAPHPSRRRLRAGARRGTRRQPSSSTACRIGEDSLIVDTNDVDRFGRHVAHVARRCDVRLREVEPTDDDLESVFRYLVERR